MILSGNEIKRQVELGNIYISDFDEKRLNPNSYNLRLNSDFITYKADVLDVKRDNPYEKFQVTKELGYVLMPGRVYLASTIEETQTNKYVPLLEGRSSLGRLGLKIHETAGFGDVGFRGVWTLELEVAQPLKIYPGIEIGQIYFHTIEGDISLYQGKYQDAFETQASKLYQEF